VKSLLSATLAATLLGTVSSLAQSAAQPQSNATSASQQSAVAKPANSDLAKPDESPAPQTAGAGSPNSQRLTDPKTGCTALAPQTVEADGIAWPGLCEAGLVTGHGTLSFTSAGKFSESLTGEFDKGALRDGQIVIRWADGSHYEGNAVVANMQGAGTLTTGAGDKFEGQWSAGLLNGKGSAIWANGDRYDGDWRDGKAEGQGTQQWADGRQYIGQWRDDAPNGHGVIRHKDGTRLEGEFADGKPTSVVQLAVSAATDAPLAAVPASSAKPIDAQNDGATTANATLSSQESTHQTAVSGIAGKKLVAVDGSSLTLTTLEDGLAREIVAPNGSVKKNVFSFLGDRVGAVSDGDDTDNVTGVFRLTEKGIVTNYSDGRSEQLFPNGAGGVSMTLNAPSGETYCMAWYPEGHRFTIDERKAALAAYASKLGLDEPSKKPAGKPAERPACGPLPKPQSTAEAPSTDHQAGPSRHALPMPRPNPHEAKAGLLLHRDSSLPQLTPASFAAPTGSSPDSVIEVRPSTPRLLDTDDASDTPGPQALASIGPVTPTKSASTCLSVESDGQHWNFRNHCGYDVQFAYCVMNAADALAACDKGGVTGSVAPHGSSALVPDNSLSEKDADHDFRWVACGGGAGEVVVHLDKAEPPTGRCVSTGRS